MNIVDKILIAILIVLLPVGIYFSRSILVDTISTTDETTIDVNKLSALIADYERLEENSKTPLKQFVISDVSYASESGSLKIEGNAPETNISVVLSVIVLPNTEVLSVEEDILESDIKQYFVLVKKDGRFSASIPLAKSLDIVEVRLEQNSIVTTIRYDILKKARLL